MCVCECAYANHDEKFNISMVNAKKKPEKLKGIFLINDGQSKKNAIKLEQVH